MKKLGLISALSLGLVLLAGCNTTSTQAPVEVTSAEQVMSMYNDGKSITCNMTYSDEQEEGTSVIYIKDQMISQEIRSTIDGEEDTMYRIVKDGKIYIWGSVYGEDVGLSDSYEFDLNEELGGFDEIDSDTTKVTCAKGVKNNSVFDLPTDVEFTSVEDLYDYDLGDYEIDEDYLDGEYAEQEENYEAEENIENEIVEENEVVEENVEEVVTE